MMQIVLGLAVEPWAGLPVAQSRDQDLNTCGFAWSAPAPATLKARIPIAASAAPPQLPILTFDPPVDVIAKPARASAAQSAGTRPELQARAHARHTAPGHYHRHAIPGE